MVQGDQREAEASNWQEALIADTALVVYSAGSRPTGENGGGMLAPMVTEDDATLA